MSNEDRDVIPAMLCEHANEVPTECRCGVNCYCRVYGCCKQEGIMAAISLIDVYAPMAEDMDGRSVDPMAYFSSPASADAFGKSRGSWGGNASVKSLKAIRVEGWGTFILADEEPIDLDLQQSLLDKELKVKALGKLTAEEKRVLGIKDGY